MRAPQESIKPKYHRVVDKKVSTNRYGKEVTAFKLRWNPELTEQALCRGIDTEIFFPDKDIFSREEEQTFVRMCSDCPVMEMCLEWAVAHERSGIWGGTTPIRRTHERKMRGWLLTDPRTM
jgi:hypothetical protein